jgi:hypothetical protein
MFLLSPSWTAFRLMLFGNMALSLVALVQADDWEGARVEQEVLDVSAPVGNMNNSFAVSATRNGCRVAKNEGNVLDGFAVRVDGKVGPRYSRIAAATPVFSEDGSSVAYCARRGVEWRWVVNGVEGPVFPELKVTSFAFSADGKHHAYIAVPSFRRNVLVVDGVKRASSDEDKAVPWDAAPVFSPDGSRLAWVETLYEAQKMRVNVNSKPGPWYSGIALTKSPGFGAYGYGEGGVATPRLQPAVFGMRFSSDGRHFAYSAVLGESWCEVIDGVPSQPHDALV